MSNRPSPVREIAHFIAKILAARQTRDEDVPQLIASIRDTVEVLQSGAGQPSVTRLGGTRHAPMISPTPQPPRQRRRSVAAERHAVVERRAEPEPPAPAVPQLMRRADVAPVPEPTSFETRPPHGGTVRGVVRWFDLNSRQGTLRLPGFGDEVVFDGAALERAGIARLYKGQEIEATLVEDGGGVRLISLALPGRVEPAAHGLFKSGAPRRNAKPVVVELKRDAMRRTAARLEAEHILGAGRDQHE